MCIYMMIIVKVFIRVISKRFENTFSMVSWGNEKSQVYACGVCY